MRVYRLVDRNDLACERECMVGVCTKLLHVARGYAKLLFESRAPHFGGSELVCDAVSRSFFTSST